MKIIFAFGLLFLPSAAFAQARGDAASLSFISYDGRGDQAFELRTGTPPIRISEKSMLINSITARRINLSNNGLLANEELKLSDYAVNSLLTTELGKWDLTSRVGVNFGNATPTLRIKRESTFYSGLMVGTRRFKNNSDWKYSLGVVVPGRGSRMPVVPALAFEYEDEGQVYQVQIGFPTSQLSYGVTPKIRIGIFASYSSNSYLLHEDSPLRAFGDYVGVDRIVTGTLFRVRLTKLIWLSTRLGYSVYGKTTLLSGGLDERRRLDEDSGFYGLVGLVIPVPRP